jgi:hypothetical protein
VRNGSTNCIEVLRRDRTLDFMSLFMFAILQKESCICRSGARVARLSSRTGRTLRRQHSHAYQSCNQPFVRTPRLELAVEDVPLPDIICMDFSATKFMS